MADESGEKPQALPKADAHAEKDKGPVQQYLQLGSERGMDGSPRVWPGRSI